MDLKVTSEDEKRVKALGFLRNKGTNNFSGRILTINGKVSSAQQKCIGEAAELFGNGSVTLTVRMTFEVQGIHYDKIDEFRKYISKEELFTGGTGAKIRPVVSCKGTTCQYGLCDTFELSEEIHRRFYLGYRETVLPHKFKIAVGGCPNNCVKPNLNDVGIIGQKIPNREEDKCRGCKKCSVEAVCPMSAPKVMNGKLKINSEICVNCGLCINKCVFNALNTGTSGYKIYIGGRWGKKISVGKALKRIVQSKEEAFTIVEKAILLYKHKGQARERFSQTIERVGFDFVESELMT